MRARGVGAGARCLFRGVVVQGLLAPQEFVREGGRAAKGDTVLAPLGVIRAGDSIVSN